MTTLNATRTTENVDGYTTSDFRTEEQWLGEATEHRGKKRELVRLAYVNKFGFSQAKLAQHLNCASSTVQKYVNELLETGELTEEHYQKKMCNSRKPKQTDHLVVEPVENSTPKFTLQTFRHQTDDSLSSTVQLRNTAECIEPSVCYVQPNMGTNMGSDQEVVSMGTEAERDLELCYEYFEKIARITGRYLFGGWREDQWYGIHGECKGISEAARIRSADLRRRIEQHASDLADSFDPTGAPRLREVTDNDGE